MYYSRMTKRFQKTYRVVTTLFILSVSLFACQLSVSAAEMFGSEADEYRIKGYEAQQNNNFDQALTYYAKAISLGLDTAAIYNDMGVIYEQIGVFPRAEENYLKAIEFDPNYLPPYTNLAYFYQDRGDTKRAIYFFQQRFKRAEEGDPWKERVRDELYRIDPQLQEEIFQHEVEELNEQIVKKAQEEFTLTVMRSEKHFQNGLRYLEQDDYDAALIEFDRALTITPNNPKILKIREWVLYEKKITGIDEKIYKAKQMFELQDFESAKKEFQEILTTIPDKAIQKPE